MPAIVSPTATPESRRALRRDLRARRRALGPAAQRRAGLALARVVAAQRPFRRARHIAAYLAADGEIDPAPLLARARAAGKRIYLPVLRRGGRMVFGELRRGRRLRRNRFGIPEPLGGRLRPGRALDLVLLPLVGFDGRGNRLGMGGGFYDRTFAFLRARPWRRPLLLGAAHALQQVERLPAQPWDVPLEAVATERGLRRPRR